MSKLWRNLVIGLAAIICFWVFTLRVYDYGVRNFTNIVSSFNQSWTNTFSTESKNRSLIGTTPPSNSCPANRNRKAFAALLHKWNVLASLHKIPYVIASGSLLGQHRNGDIIPWDEDMDVLVDIKMFEAMKVFGGKRNFQQGSDNKFHFVVQKDFRQRKEDDRRRLSCPGKVVESQIDSCSFVSPMARLIYGFRHLDVFPFVVDRDKQKVRDLDVAVTYNLKDFFPYKKCVFINVITWCPRNIRVVLEAEYHNIEPVYRCVNRTWVRTGD